jgi:hypothetical protein
MYNYTEIKPRLFTEEGSRLFLSIRDRTFQLLKVAGAVRLQEAALLGNAGDSWTMIACMDRMVELGEIREITSDKCAGQYRVFVSMRDR